jgi:putative glutamine amidotransferase
MIEKHPITPVLMPNSLKRPVEFLRSIEVNGLLLTGGNDLGPLKGEIDWKPDTMERDFTENQLLQWAVDKGIPVFGVCRGLQLINVYFNGGIERNLKSIGSHVKVNHKVSIVSETMKSLEGLNEIITNSYHNNGVLLSGLSSELEVFAMAENDVVEGVSHPNLPIIAVQWHPERKNPAHELDNNIFLEWLSLCD